MKTAYDYKIEFVEVPSNLGKGKVLFFICPQTLNKCRILYKCYGSPKWKSREAYKYRIYYECQMVSKKDYYNDTYWSLDKKINEMLTQKINHTYKGKLTKRFLKLQKLRTKQDLFDKYRWTIGLTKGLRKYYDLYGYES